MVWMKVPYTNFHNLNQDWIIRRMQEFEDYMQNIVQISVIKYADPIQWRITGQYEQSTVVIDAESGIAYISVQPVPAGVAITNTNYWTPVFDMSQILAGIEADLQAETDARTAADADLRMDLDAEITARTDADTTMAGDITANATAIADETAARISAIDTLQALIDDISKDGFVGARIKDHTRYYINNEDGDDANDGRSESTPFRTIDRFLDESDKYSEIRGYIMTPGRYRVTKGNVAAGISIHLNALTAGAILDFITVEDQNTPAWAVYQSHWNFAGLDNANKMQIQVHGSDNREGLIYFDNCLSSFTDVEFQQYVRVFGGQFTSSKCNYARIELQHAIYSFADTTGIINTNPSINPINVINSYGRFIGGYTALELTTTGTANFLTVNGGYCVIGSVMLPELNNQYAHSISAYNWAVVNITNSRLNSMAARAPIDYPTNNQYCYITDIGVRVPGSVRYSGSAYQYWNGTTHAWTNIA